MRRKYIFRSLRWILFLVVSLIIVSFGWYFPNMPPAIRQIIVEHRVNLVKSKAKEADPRFLAWFSRDPERNIPTEPRIIVAPADGYVAATTTRGGRKHVVIEMRYTDVHVQRVPISGKVIKVEGEGQQLPAGMMVGDYTLSKMAPYQKMTTLETEIGEVVVRQITSFFAKRIQVYVHEGEVVHRGQRLGSVLAGSTVVVELPMNVEILVKKEQNVLAGETIIARY